MAKDPTAQLTALIGVDAPSSDQVSQLITVGLELAQLGRCDAAGSALSVAKKFCGLRNEHSSAVRCLLLEGVLHYYEGRYTQALDRVKRACVLSEGFSLVRTRAEAEVWYGHLLYNLGDFRIFAKSLLTAFDLASHLSDSSLARLCLTAADLVEYSREGKQSNEWYTLARLFSRRAGSRAVMVAIEYNRLASGLSRVRRLSMLDEAESVESRKEWAIELSSVLNMHVGLGADAFPELLRIARARVLQMQGDFLEAASLLQGLQRDQVESKCGLTAWALKIESMWCMTRAGQASSDASMGCQLDAMLAELDADDRVACLRMMRDLGGPEEMAVDECLAQAMVDLREEMIGISKLALQVDGYRDSIKNLIDENVS